MEINAKLFKIAYKKLKSSLYYDKTQTILRDIGEDPARRQRHHRMDRMVSVLPRTCADRQYRSLKIGIGESRILGNP